MPNKNVQYKVYRNSKSKAVLPSESEAFEYLKKSAQRHPKAHFIIEKREVVFDSRENVEDQKRLSEMRKPERSNAIHASIHWGDRNIGREDDE